MQKRASHTSGSSISLLETLEVYRLDAGRWVVAVTHAADAVARVEPFDALELRLGRWWVPPAGG
jgi:hypothetical protein